MTNTIKTIIVDDEINSIHNLEEDLKAYPEIEILDTITSSQKAKKSIIQYQPDLLFLDVEMPYINGIELLQEIRPYVRNNMRVIFYSAFDKYMLDALRASAFDYLLKPYQTCLLYTSDAADCCCYVGQKSCIFNIRRIPAVGK